MDYNLFHNHVIGDSAVQAYITTQSDTIHTYSWSITSQPSGNVVYSSTSHQGYILPVTLPTGIYQVCLEEFYHGQLCGDTCKYDTIHGSTHCPISAYWYYAVSGDTLNYYSIDTNTTAHHFWNFGDGSSVVSGVSGYHVYNPGNYHVCIFVYIPGTSCIDSFCRNIGITSLYHDTCVGLSANWSVINQSGNTVQFLASDTVGGDHRYWNYGDGTNSYTICQCHPVEPSHTFPGPGTYHVCLVNYRPGSNCPVDSSCQTIIITSPPQNANCPELSLSWNYTIHGDTLDFHFCFYSISADCNDSLCQNVIVISPLVLYLEEIETTSGIQLYPNPFNQSTEIRISNNINPPFTLCVYSSNGELISKEIINNNKYDMIRGSLSSGVYIFQIYKDDKIIGKGKMIAN